MYAKGAGIGSLAHTMPNDKNYVSKVRRLGGLKFEDL
jgi:hypothetical protein